MNFMGFKNPIRSKYVPFFLLCIGLLFYYRNHIIYHGVSKITIVNHYGEFNFTVPNKMVPRYRRPTYGDVGGFPVDLDPKSIGGQGKYTLYLDGNVDYSAKGKALPVIVNMSKEVVSDFAGYKKYMLFKDDNADFILVKPKGNGDYMYLQCAKQISIWTKCKYYGFFNEKLSYEFSFPISEINNFDSLVAYSIESIDKLVDKEQ